MRALPLLLLIMLLAGCARQQENAQQARYQRVFPAGQPFTSEAETSHAMNTITVQAWGRDRRGRLRLGHRRVTVNANLAAEVRQIFDEIAADPERFPIKRLEGYSFRRMRSFDALSHHSYGTALDINADENYFIDHQTGQRVGRCWQPGVNPYSLPANGSVVRAFKRHGWYWGGDVANPTDYMHFSYLGG
jgi:hypothetical protein